MKMRRWLAVAACSLAFSSSAPALAQLAPPNDIGVALGHIHLAVKDVEAHKQFWTTMLGGTVVTNGPLTLIQFPGIFIMLRQGDTTGSSCGSMGERGFLLRDCLRRSMRTRGR